MPPIEGTSKRGNTWIKRTFVIQLLGTTYETHVAFDLFGDNINNPNLVPGTMVRVTFMLSSHESNGRWYTSATAWKVESIKPTLMNEPPTQQTSGTSNQQPMATQAPAQQVQQDPEGDLPF